MRQSSGGMTSLVLISRFDWRAKGVPAAGFMLRVTSSDPKRRLKAICFSSSSAWPRKRRTGSASKAARISAHVESSTGRVMSAPSIRAAKAGVSGVTLMVIVCSPSLTQPSPRRCGSVSARTAALSPSGGEGDRLGEGAEALRGHEDERVGGDHEAAEEYREARVHRRGQRAREEAAERQQVPAQRVQAHDAPAQVIRHVLLEIGADLHQVERIAEADEHEDGQGEDQRLR